MSRAGTREILGSGNVLSILNCLMQLRKVCAHPDLFEPRPIMSAFALPPLAVPMPALVVVDVPGDGDLAAAPSAVLQLQQPVAGAAPGHPTPPPPPRPTLLDDGQVQRLIARVTSAVPNVGKDLQARLQRWTGLDSPTVFDDGGGSGDNAPRPIRQRLPLVINPPSWAQITAVKVPLRPCDRVQLDVHKPRKYVAVRRPLAVANATCL